MNHILPIAGNLSPWGSPIFGYVDFYGYHETAGGWFFAGWLPRATLPAPAPFSVTAHFAETRFSAGAQTLFFPRGDLDEASIGFLFFLKAAPREAGAFNCLTLDLVEGPARIDPVGNASCLPEALLADQLHFILGACEDLPARRPMALLAGAPPAAVIKGFVEFHGYHAGAGGWFVSGWLRDRWPQGEAPESVLLSFTAGPALQGELALVYPRLEVPEGGQGFTAFIQGGPRPGQALSSVSFYLGGHTATLVPQENAAPMEQDQLSIAAAFNAGLARPGPARTRLQSLAARKPYRGEDTLDRLAPAVSFYVDEAMPCGADGLLLVGWMLALPHEVAAIRLRCGPRSTELRLDNCLRLERPDVMAKFASQGFETPFCGFVAWLPGAVEPGQPIYIELETASGAVGYRGIPRPARSGIGAIKQLLGMVHTRFADMQEAYDKVLGPAVQALNETRLAVRPDIEIIEYGTVPAAPLHSVVIPLYGRVDFVEIQLGLLSAHPRCAQAEFIFVLDDPPKRLEALRLFESIYQRFRIPFRAIFLDRNMGFAPACNIGLAQAHGRYVAFLNSDVFPGSLDWLDQLSNRLQNDETLGAVAPLLLFEDGSVQHQGMTYERLAEFGNWFFCQHPNKGRRYTGGSGLLYPQAITGACIVMPRALASRIGGFDEAYVIGDFEDSDLCLRLYAMGLRCAVDPSVRLFHLERKSQDSPALNWRMNITAYNAWRHQQLWAGLITERQALGRAA